jgi:hypothetical protein
MPFNRIQAIRVFERYADIFPLTKQRDNFLQKELGRRNFCCSFGESERDLQRVKITHTLSQNSIELRAIQSGYYSGVNRTSRSIQLSAYGYESVLATYTVIGAKITRAKYRWFYTKRGIIMNIMQSPSNIGSMKTNPYRKCNKLDGLQVETYSLNYKVVRPVVDISKSVSPDSTEIIFGYLY